MFTQFSFEFILRRLEGDALSTIIDTELVRLAVGVRVVCWSVVKANKIKIKLLLN